MDKEWHEEVWEPIKIKLEVPKDSYPKRETKSFYDHQSPEEGYEVRGVRPTYREIKHPESDCY